MSDEIFPPPESDDVGVILCGGPADGVKPLGGEDFALCPKCGDRLCPKCGNGHVEQGYGLMGGGCGLYEFCTADECDYFRKDQDPDEGAPTPGEGPAAPPEGGR